MGTRGPEPTRKPRLNFAAGVPSPGAYLSDAAKAEYRRVVRILAKTPGHLQQVDMAVLEIYAEAFAESRALEAEIRTEGATYHSPNGFHLANPKCALRAAALKRLALAVSRLGFSPFDRAKVGTRSAPAKAANPLADLIGGMQ